MKSLIIISLFLFSNFSFAGLEESIYNCYSQDRAQEAASLCADLKLAQAIKNIDKPPAPPVIKYSTTFSCKMDTDPQLLKKIFDSTGKVIRNKIIKTYSAGRTIDKNRQCLNEVLKKRFKLIKGIITECTCSSETEPRLELTMLDEDYKQIAVTDIVSFTEGSENKKNEDCEKAIVNLNVCHIE